MTLLDAGGHGVTDGGGEVGCKRPLLGVLRQDWGGLGTIDWDWEPGPGGRWHDRGGLIDGGFADGRRREQRRQRIDRRLVTGCSGHYSVDLDESKRNA